MVHTGRLLVATPVLVDPSFERTVVLVLAHDEDGALGLVLNRPTTTRVRDVLPDWVDVVAPPPCVFGGGPVEPRAVVGLGLGRPGRGGWEPIVGRLRTIDPSAEARRVADEVDRARVYAGYAGWGAGQLESELAEEAWVVVDAVDTDPFVADPGSLWSDVLRRQDGGLALLASFPEDPRLN